MEAKTESGSNRQMGMFISEMRKAHGLTQKELAEKLGVTDKAVSKWERGLSCPDIALLLPLAGLLEVSAEELLNGRRMDPVSQTGFPEDAAPEDTVPEEILAFPAPDPSRKTKQLKLCLLLGVSAVFLLAAMICLICDYFTAQVFTWSLPVLASLGFAWILLFPFSTAWKRPLPLSLSLLSIFLIPYLALLSRLFKSPLLLHLGSCISVVSLAGLWCIYGVFSRYYSRKYRAFGLFFLITALMSLGISLATTRFLGEDESGPGLVLKILLSLALSALCFLLDYYKTRSQNHMT